MSETNKRWKRLRRGKFGRVSKLEEFSITGRDKWWIVEYFYLDGMEDKMAFDTLKEAHEAQHRFLNGGRP